MIIGRLNRRIELQPPKRVMGENGYVTEWETAETTWAEFMKVRAESIAFSGGMKLEIAVRYRTDIKKGWHVKDESGTVYDVKGIYHIFRDRTVLVCEEVPDG